jgi:thymidylate synthase (FAD)
MKFVKQTCESYIQEPGLSGIYKQIELAGRTCYHSTDKITTDSAEEFVERMIKSHHNAMLEHATVYLHREIPKGSTSEEFRNWDMVYTKYSNNPYSRVVTNHTNKALIFDITTNYRVLVGNNWLADLRYICEPNENHEKRFSLHCVTALQVYKELTRHRVFSFAIESSRYCAYNKNKFGNSLTFILPTWFKYITEGNAYFLDGVYHSGGRPENENIGDRIWDKPRKNEDGTEWHAEETFLKTMDIIESSYLQSFKQSWVAQQAAQYLPQCIKGEVVITGFESDWKYLLDLRLKGITGAPHPMMKELAALMKEELVKQGFKY